MKVQARHPGNCNLPQSVSGEDHRQNHSQGANGENPIQNQSQRVIGEKKNEVRQHGYEDSEKYIEATMRSQSSAQSSRRGETMKRTEKSKANSRQKSKANSKQSKPKNCDRDKGVYEEKYTLQSKAAATHPNSDADVQQQSIQSASHSQMFSRGNTS